MDEHQIEKIDLEKVDWRGSREFFESLGEALDKLDDKDEAYDFTWVGKRKAIIEAGAPINKTFRPDIESSKNWDTTENLYIEGDNLDALKLLQESYLGKVKMIYIDPPYNTGKDFVYHDNFKASVEEYDEATEYKDETGNIQFKKNEKSNGRYHSDWLSMMYPRLKLARNLLSDDGVIFISIDDNEQTNLRKLCDEIFGEDTFIETFVWQKKTQPSFLSKEVAEVTEYILAYKRSIDVRPLKGGETDTSRTSEMINIGNPIGDRTIPKEAVEIENGNYTGTLRAGAFGNGVLAVNLLEDVVVEGGKPLSDIKIRAKIVQSQATLDEGVRNGWQIYIKSTRSLRPTINKNRQEAGIRPPISLLSKKLDSKIPTNTDASAEIKELFNGINIMDYPKPSKLIKYLVDAVTYDDPEAIILDFFSGSGTTADAVMQLNAEGGARRKWIMVQLPEIAAESSEAYKAGYKTIPAIARERVRRAGEKTASVYPDVDVDYGFRALTISDTNYNEVYRSAGELQQSTLLDVVDNVKEDRSDLDLLYGVLTQSALELNRPIEKREIAGSDTYLYDYFGEVSGLIGCFSEQVSEEAIKEIAKHKPLTAVFRDSSFADSQAKVNLSEHFRILSPETKVKVI